MQWHKKNLKRTRVHHFFFSILPSTTSISDPNSLITCIFYLLANVSLFSQGLHSSRQTDKCVIRSFSSFSFLFSFFFSQGPHGSRQTNECIIREAARNTFKPMSHIPSILHAIVSFLTWTDTMLLYTHHFLPRHTMNFPSLPLEVLTPPRPILHSSLSTPSLLLGLSNP